MTRPAPTSTLFPYTTLFRSAGNLEPIPQKIETELGGHAVRHVAAISSDALFVGHFHLQNTDGQSQSVVNRPDPLGVAAGQIVIDRRDVNPFAQEGIEASRHRG